MRAKATRYSKEYIDEHGIVPVARRFWYEDALCRFVDYQTPDKENGRKGKSKEEDEKFIQEYCKKCAVRSDCLADALISNSTTQVFGGLSAAKRQPIHQTYNKWGKIAPEVWEKAEGTMPITKEGAADNTPELIPSNISEERIVIEVALRLVGAKV